MGPTQRPMPKRLRRSTRRSRVSALLSSPSTTAEVPAALGVAMRKRRMRHTMSCKSAVTVGYFFSIDQVREHEPALDTGLLSRPPVLREEGFVNGCLIAPPHRRASGLPDVS